MRLKKLLILASVAVLLMMFSAFTQRFQISGLNKPVAVKNIDSTGILEFNSFTDHIYDQAGLAKAGLDKALFTRALTGYFGLKAEDRLSDQKEIVSIVDFRRPSSQKRLWIVDLKANKLLFHTYVSHGRNSGELYARSFSNEPNSYKSSLGFYVTNETYQGKHGLSLRLDGMENTNDLARDRAIVMHGADYVSRDFVKAVGRLGLSHGCPAVSTQLTQPIINTISGKTVLFMYYPDAGYEQTTGYNDVQLALQGFTLDQLAMREE